MTDVETVAAFWDALYARDWPGLRSFFDEDAVYWDVPLGPAFAARGPDGIEARLRLGLEPLTSLEHEPGTTVAGDGVVMTEHVEVWHFPSGEVVPLPFVSVHHVRNGTLAVWKDYWNYGTLVDAAPAWWHERLAASDLAWLYDASHLA